MVLYSGVASLQTAAVVSAVMAYATNKTLYDKNRLDIMYTKTVSLGVSTLLVIAMPVYVGKCTNRQSSIDPSRLHSLAALLLVALQLSILHELCIACDACRRVAQNISYHAQQTTSLRQVVTVVGPIIFFSFSNEYFLAEGYIAQLETSTDTTERNVAVYEMALMAVTFTSLALWFRTINNLSIVAVRI